MLQGKLQILQYLGQSLGGISPLNLLIILQKQLQSGLTVIETLSYQLSGLQVRFVDWSGGRLGGAGGRRWGSEVHFLRVVFFHLILL
jgi:hypothetical protein